MIRKFLLILLQIKGQFPAGSAGREMVDYRTLPIKYIHVMKRTNRRLKGVCEAFPLIVRTISCQFVYWAF